ncbi:MAG: 4-alpha-glucanotransferase [Spirochaetales bacterium]|nr:4-alpha-glucanotransferase [Spirochaetales bacterium]
MAGPAGARQRRAGTVQRRAGVLLHPTSLPGPHGIGSLGAPAHAFVDFLRRARQSLWQILPLGPTGYGDSPYQSFSSFAGNPLLIDLPLLVEEGLLLPREVEAALPGGRELPADRVDYGAVIPFKNAVLRRVHAAWKRRSGSALQEELAEFCRRNAFWLEDYSLFMGLKRRYASRRGGVWPRWPRELVHRQPAAMETARAELAEAVSEQKLLQFLFHRQWQALKRHANRQGVGIIGDIPIFVAYDSADVWAHQELFRLDPDGNPTAVAGVPPDYFSATGQLWGNPLYDWERHQATGYRWWIDRIRTRLEAVDLLRLDHFRGFEAFWEVPAGDQTAEKGRWVQGPGLDFFEALERELGSLPLIAEDLGFITEEVVELRERLGLPGMKVLQFAFDGDSSNTLLPHHYSEDCVVYTGTHDNDTTLGWYESQEERTRDFVRRYLARDGHDISWDLVRLAFASVGRVAMVPLQDLMSLGSEARMNFPSRAHGNWQWRYQDWMLRHETADRLGELTELYDRVADGHPEHPSEG